MTTPKSKPRTLCAPAPLVSALLAGARVIRVPVMEQPPPGVALHAYTTKRGNVRYGLNPPEPGWNSKYFTRDGIKCPLGEPGDELVVKEVWAQHYTRIPTMKPHYRADLPDDPDAAMTKNHAFGLMRWRPARTMPLWAARLRYRVLSVKPQQLKDVSVEEAEAEVDTNPANFGATVDGKPMKVRAINPLYAYGVFWNACHPRALWSPDLWTWAASVEPTPNDGPRVAARKAAIQP